MLVSKAVITAAGAASRHLPLQRVVDTDGVSRTVLSILIREAAAAGIERVCVVVHSGDEQAYVEAVQDCQASVHFIAQDEPRGYGDAILRARDFVAGEGVLHMVGDHLYVGRSCAEMLVRTAEAQRCSVSAVRATRENLLTSFGVVGGQPDSGHSGLWRIDAVHEKPTPTVAEQKLIVAGMRAGHYLAFFGMHVLSPSVFPILEECVAARPSASLSDALAVLARRERYLAMEASADRFDLGSRFGLLAAQLALGLRGSHRDEVLSLLVQTLAADAALTEAR